MVNLKVHSRSQDQNEMTKVYVDLGPKRPGGSNLSSIKRKGVNETEYRSFGFSKFAVDQTYD